SRELNRVEDFHIAKGVSVDTLIALGFSSKAFDLAVRFHYFLGITRAALDVSPSELRPQLQQVLSGSGDVEAIVDPFPRVVTLAAFCFEWLEHHGKFAELLEIGRCAPEHLKIFLRSRPYLGWLRALADRNYLDAAEASHKFCRGEGGERQGSDKRTKSSSLDLLSAKTVLSVGKLCGWVHMLDVAAEGQVAVHTSDEVVETMDRALLAVRAQQCIASHGNPKDSAKVVAPHCSWDALDLVSKLLAVNSRDNADQVLLKSLSLALRLLLLELCSQPSDRMSDRRRGTCLEFMLKLWRAAVHGDVPLWIHAAAISTGTSGVSGDLFDESQLEEVMSRTILYKLLREALAFNTRTVAANSDAGDTTDAVDLFVLCTDIVLQDNELISPAVFDDSLQSGHPGVTNEELKVVNDISRQRIHIVVKKCINFARIE
ncbi:unnamed protein product, partial [Symbiodinium microadriaticum]